MYFVIHKNCFYLCLLAVFVVDSFNCEFRPLLVLSKGLFTSICTLLWNKHSIFRNY